MGLTQAERDAVARWAAESELRRKQAWSQEEKPAVLLVREASKIYRRHELLAKYVKALDTIEAFLDDCAAFGVNPAIVWPVVSTETKRYKAVVTIVPLNGGSDEEGQQER